MVGVDGRRPALPGVVRGRALVAGRCAAAPGRAPRPRRPGSSWHPPSARWRAASVPRSTRRSSRRSWRRPGSSGQRPSAVGRRPRRRSDRSPGRPRRPRRGLARRRRGSSAGGRRGRRSGTCTRSSVTAIGQQRAASLPRVATDLEDVGRVVAQLELDVDRLVAPRAKLTIATRSSSASPRDQPLARDPELPPDEARRADGSWRRGCGPRRVRQLDDAAVVAAHRALEQRPAARRRRAAPSTTGAACRRGRGRARASRGGCRRTGRSAGTGCRA